MKKMILIFLICINSFAYSLNILLDNSLYKYNVILTPYARAVLNRSFFINHSQPLTFSQLSHFLSAFNLDFVATANNIVIRKSYVRPFRLDVSYFRLNSFLNFVKVNQLSFSYPFLFCTNVTFYNLVLPVLSYYSARPRFFLVVKSRPSFPSSTFKIVTRVQ